MAVFSRFLTFFDAVFYFDLCLLANHVYVAKNIPRCLFLAAGRLRTFYTAVKCLLPISRLRLPACRNGHFEQFFFYFFGAVVIFYLYGQTMYILQKKNCPQKSFPGRGEFFRKFICFVTATRPLNYYDYKSTCGAKNMVCGIYRVQLFVYWRRVITPSCC